MKRLMMDVLPTDWSPSSTILHLTAGLFYIFQIYIFSLRTTHAPPPHTYTVKNSLSLPAQPLPVPWKKVSQRIGIDALGTHPQTPSLERLRACFEGLLSIIISKWVVTYVKAMKKLLGLGLHASPVSPTVECSPSESSTVCIEARRG